MRNAECKMRNAKRRRRSMGFTLIELLVVMGILVILAGAVTVYAIKRIDDAKRARAKADLANIETALDSYYLDVGDYPTTSEGLQALITPPSGGSRRWNGPYLRRVKTVPKDPWGNDYVYRYPSERGTGADYDLYSLGKDGAEGGVGNNADIFPDENQ